MRAGKQDWCPEGSQNMQSSSNRSYRRAAAGMGFVLVLAACGSDDGTQGTTPANPTIAPSVQDTAPQVQLRTEPSTPTAVEQIESSPAEVRFSGLAMLRGAQPEGVPEPAVPLSAIRSGGPPPDGIPPIDEPLFLAPGSVDFLAENEPVLAIEINGDARAYPVQILMWHEIVNDTIGGVPATVSYCPLCNSAVAYDRRVGDLIVDFGTSGSLYNSALIMYDRQTETLWSHFSAQGIVGELTGVQLDTFPLATVPWGLWRDAHPEGLVLSRKTGFSRDYGRNPYPGYDDVSNVPFLFEGEVDGRFTAMTRLVGVDLGDEQIGVPLVLLQEQRVVTTTSGDTELVVLWAPGSASALDTTAIADGDDIGATGVFVSEVDGEPVGFTAGPTDGQFIDDATGSVWNLFGRAVQGALTGTQLERVEHVDTFWFAWAAFRPDTRVISN
jgi:hypothetical protein